jgi:hypothetical protein
MSGTTDIEPITIASIEEIAGVVPEDLIINLFETCQNARTAPYMKLNPLIHEIISEGWSAGTIINQVNLSSIVIYVQ